MWASNSSLSPPASPWVLPAAFRILREDRDVKSMSETHDEKLGYDISERHPSKFESGFQVVCANPAVACVFYKVSDN